MIGIFTKTKTLGNLIGQLNLIEKAHKKKYKKLNVQIDYKNLASLEIHDLKYSLLITPTYTQELKEKSKYPIYKEDIELYVKKHGKISDLKITNFKQQLQTLKESSNLNSDKLITIHTYFNNWPAKNQEATIDKIKYNSETLNIITK